jgi:penicillin amidase
MGDEEGLVVEEGELLAALQGKREVAEVCRAAGIGEAEFAAARQAYLQQRLPAVEVRLETAVQGPVEILCDQAGVPHIYAGTTPDLYFGLGFATAQDRLWQLDRLRRRGMGRQAEILGPEYVRTDLLHRTVGIDRIAAAEGARLDEATRLVVEAYVGGINRHIEMCLAGQGHRGQQGSGGRNAGSHGVRPALPIEFAILDYEPEPFTVQDVIAILRGMWWSLNGRLENLAAAEAARLLPTEELRQAYLTPEAPEERILPPGSAPASGGSGTGDATGSNNWAVAGQRLPSGKAILCSDPHQPFWLPGSWYEYAVHGPQDDAAGAGHPGVPGLWWGTNGAIAWGLTNNAASTRDLYVEETDPHDPRRYRDAGTWRHFEERVVEIAVRGAEPQRHVIRATVRGPLVEAFLPTVSPAALGAPAPLSLRWVGLEHLDDLRALLAIGRARNWEAFRRALRDWAIPVFNFGYADHTGRVGYQCAGRIPIRGRARYGYREAGEPADAWRGYVPFEQLPRLEEPPAGYIASANQRVASDDYPYTPQAFYGAWASGHRAARLRQVLHGTGQLNLQAMLALQNDVKGTRAERLCPPLLRRLAAGPAGDAPGGAGGPAASRPEGTPPADPHVRLLYDLLRHWNYRYSLDSAAPTVFETFMYVWQEHVAAERFDPRLLPLVRGQGSVAAQLIETGTLPWVAGGAPALHAALQHAARATIDRLRQRFGPDPAAWRWGTVHLAHWRHPLSNPATAPLFDLGPVPVDGGQDTVRNTGCSPTLGATSGAEYRLVVDFATPERFYAVQNAGNSGQPGSRHYAGQLPLWLAADYHVVHLQRPAVEAGLERKTTLSPPAGDPPPRG